jgi:hypothetical protein
MATVPTGEPTRHAELREELACLNVAPIDGAVRIDEAAPAWIATVAAQRGVGPVRHA